MKPSWHVKEYSAHYAGQHLLVYRDGGGWSWAVGNYYPKGEQYEKLWQAQTAAVRYVDSSPIASLITIDL